MQRSRNPHFENNILDESIDHLPYTYLVIFLFKQILFPLNFLSRHLGVHLGCS
jgi:hypothetical protein